MFRTFVWVWRYIATSTWTNRSHMTSSTARGRRAIRRSLAGFTPVPESRKLKNIPESP